MPQVKGGSTYMLLDCERAWIELRTEDAPLWREARQPAPDGERDQYGYHLCACQPAMHIRDEGARTWPTVMVG